MKIANQDIRTQAKSSGILLWQIADILKIRDSEFSRMLRHELSEAEKAKIFAIIETLKEGE